jgi:hypothetical protein
MRFPALRRHWERLGRRDPYWAVLTDPDKRGGGWNIDDFFRSGVDEIDAPAHSVSPWRAAARSTSAAARDD